MASQNDRLSERTPAAVGMVTRNFADAGRKNWQGTGPRPLRTILWYPAAAGSKEETLRDLETGFAPIQVALSEVAPAPPKYPLILISHGATGTAQSMAWLGYSLAARGYIAAIVDHSGSPA